MASSRQHIVLGNIVLVIVLNLLVKPFWVFFIDRVIQVQNGNSLFGIYGKYLSLSIVMNILLDMGLSSHNQLSVAADGESVERDFGKFWNAKLVLAVLYLGVLHFMFWLLGSPAEEYRLFLMVALIQIFTSLALYIRSSVSGLHLFRYDAWLSVIDKFFVLLVATSIIYGMGQSIHVADYAALQALGFFMVVAVGVTLLGVRRALITRFSLTDFKQAIRSGLPFAFLIFCMSLYTRFDFFLIERYAAAGAAAAGEYMAAYRFIDIIGGVGFLFSSILLSVFARNIAQKHSSKETIDFYFLLFVGLGFVISSFVYSYALPITDLLYREGISSTSASLAILIWSVPAMFATNIFSTYLTAARDLMTLIYISLGAAVLYLVLNIALLPSQGILLTSTLSVITFWVLSILLGLRAYLAYGITLSFWPQIIITALVSLVTNLLLSETVSWPAAAAVNVLIATVFLFWVYKKRPQAT